MSSEPASPEAVSLAGSGAFVAPGRPVLVYRQVVGPREGPAAFEALFARNGWTGSWRNGIFDYDHVHTTAHEVLGIAAGRAVVGLGGPGGPAVTVEAGDVLVLPAGAAHRRDESSPDLLVVGAYAEGRNADLRRGDADLPAGRDRLMQVPMPLADPVAGPAGPLVQLWAAVPEAPPGAP